MHNIQWHIKQCKRFLPVSVLYAYHFMLAFIAVVRYGHPSKKMIIIGVTGTKGKTSTVTYIQQILNAAGLKTASLSTAEIRIGDQIEPNTAHLTMQGRGHIQRKLKEFLAAGCRCAIVETSSEGILQFRHYGIEYDSVVFTNLSEEHLVTHKTFENYRDTKLRLFLEYSKRQFKYIQGKAIKRFALINIDDVHGSYFADAAKSDTGTIITYGIDTTADKHIRVFKEGTQNTFMLEDEQYTVSLPGVFNIYNVVPAIIFAKEYTDADSEIIQKAINTVLLPGRLEKIDVGQKFSVYCDYAHEPLSITSVCTALRTLLPTGKRLILSVGTVGGGRWKYNAKKIGEVATKYADVTIMTTADPFYDNINEMMAEMKLGAMGVEGEDYMVEVDRKKAIQKTLAHAEEGDIVVITGKGAEVTYEAEGVSKEWDERAIIRKALQEHIKKYG